MYFFRTSVYDSFFIFCVRVQFFWRRSLETDTKELHKPPVKKQIVLSKHDIKLKILRFSIVNSAAFVFQQLLFKSNQLWLFHRF